MKTRRLRNAAVSRFRYDQLMSLARKGCIPVDYDRARLPAPATLLELETSRAWQNANAGSAALLEGILGRQPTQDEADLAGQIILWLVGEEGQNFVSLSKALADARSMIFDTSLTAL